MRAWHAVAMLALLVPLVPVADAQEPLIPRRWSFTEAVSNDPIDGNTIDGVLTAQGSGGIAWSDSAAEGQGVYGPAASVAAWAGWSLHSFTGGAAGDQLIPALQFTSDPFPEDIYVDVGRVMQVNAIVKVFSCSNAGYQFSMEARINDEIWGGVPRGVAAQIHQDGNDPSPPGGWCLVRLYFHTETDVIRAGDVITLTIYYHHYQATDLADMPAIRLGGDHPSTIRVPFYPPDEAAIRRPEFQGEGSVPLLLGAGGALGLLLVPAGRRRGLVALLILVPALAGCASGPDSESSDGGSGGEQQYTIEPGDPDATGGNGTGLLVGLVHDVQNVPVSGAHVALLGTDFSAQTDKRGKFSFDELAAGTYQYRLDHRDFRSFEETVEVKAGAVTRLEVLLHHKDNRTGDQLAHRHSMWPASGHKVLFDGAIGQNIVCAWASEGLYLSGGDHCEMNVPLPLGDEAIVPPGTQRLEVTITWDGGTGKRAGIYFTPNGEPYEEGYGYVNNTVMWPRQSGETTTIQVPWELADAGHQEWSVWKWHVWFPLDAFTLLGLPWARAMTYEGDMHVKIEAFKGVVPLEPPHVDLWKGKDSLVVVDRVSDPYRMVTSRIPYETNWLEITLERDRETLGTNEKLMYTAADSPARYSPGSKEREVVFPEDGLKQSVKWPLLPGEPDPPYAKSTYWEFFVGRPSYLEDPEALLAYSDEYVQGQVTFTLTVVAHRTDVPSDAAERSE